MMPPRPASLFLASLALFAASSTATRASAGSIPVSIYIHGFELSGAGRHGVFGEDNPNPVADSVAALAGVPPGYVMGTTYYGDTPPSYYTDADRAELERITAAWDGGVPRYAFIVGRHARWLMERTGATQVNVISASFGSLVARWMIEKNVSGLAEEKRIARWLSIEGVIGGNWIASHHDLVKILSAFEPRPVDVVQMTYPWVETYLHAPRTEAASPYYGDILMGQTASTDDGGPGNPLRTAMLLYDDYRPNDQIQAISDAWFNGTLPEARYLGMPPTRAVFHSSHLGIKDERGAWAQAATFLTGTRRVTVAITGATVYNLAESSVWYWNWMPAEVLFESWVHAPAAEARWGAIGSLCSYVKEGASPPIRRYRRRGEHQVFTHVVFDDFVLPEETGLRIQLRANELDYDPRYGVFETARTPHHDDLGGGSVMVSTLQPGNYTFTCPGWSCDLTVSVFDYPTRPVAVIPRGILDPPPGNDDALRILTGPSYSDVRIRVPAFAPAGPGEVATLEVIDVSGRLVRTIDGNPREDFGWDGRDGNGRAVGSGVYLYRVTSPRGRWIGKGFLLR